MDFTREPIVETVITPKEGCKIVVRSSKGTAQEEFFVDAVEVVSFGNAFFYRSLERPKSFLVPVSDYEILEVREARMVLKHVGLDRSIKIGGGREVVPKAPREVKIEKEEALASEEEGEEGKSAEEGGTPLAESRFEKKRDRRRQYRRRRGGRDEQPAKDANWPEGEESGTGDEQIPIPPPRRNLDEEVSTPREPGTMATSLLSSLLPPPLTLISETIGRYKDNAIYKNAFYIKDEEQQNGEQASVEETAALEQAITSIIDERKESLGLELSEPLHSPTASEEIVRSEQEFYALPPHTEDDEHQDHKETVEQENEKKEESDLPL